MHESLSRHDRVAIIDFGSQYTQLIARRVRELSVYSEIFPASTGRETLEQFAPKCLILSGGPESVVDARRKPECVANFGEFGVPVLGICYGMQLIAQQYGGKVEPAVHREYGHACVTVKGGSRLFGRCGGPGDGFDVWMSHGDRVVGLPGGFEAIGTSANSPIAAMANEEQSCYGLQFHPEVTHTACGKEILEAFVCDIASCERNWRISDIIEESVEMLCERIGGEEVVLGLSGGVDSSVAALLIHRAIGGRLHCVFVDNGLLRLGEREQVIKTFAEHFKMDLRVVGAARKFLQALEGVRDPEEKRRIIGNVFIDVFEREAKRLQSVQWLAQGTIYPDVIESAGREGAHLIKSHHNVGGLPEKMNLKLLEPLSSLFKDEVRMIGKSLGLDEKLISRHPFPGPGLAVRVIGEVNGRALDLLRRADAIFIEEIERNGLYHKVAQAFAVFLPVRSVGVMGDSRQYGNVIVLRAVETDDFMTARCARLPPDFVDHVARRIVNEVHGISRVCYDVSGKPPATVEWE